MLAFVERRISVVYHGRREEIRYRPSDHPWQKLGCQLVDTLVEKATEDDLAKSTINYYVKAIRDFCKFLGEKSEVRAHGLESDADSISEGIYSWSGFLRSKYPRRSKSPSRQVAALCSLIVHCAGSGRPVGALTLKRAQAGSLMPRSGDSDNLLPEFSNRERLLIRDSARQQVRELEQRLLLGRYMLSPTHHSSQEQYPEISRMLRSMSEGQAPDLESTDLMSIAWPPETLNLGYRDRTSPRLSALRRLSSLLGPLGRDLQGFRVLLLQASGWAPEEVHDLLISETTATVDGRIYIRRKARAQSMDEQPVPHGRSGEWDFNGLIDRLLLVTAIIRTMGDATVRDWYFISVSGHLPEPAVRVATFHDDPVSFSSWVKYRELDLTMPHDVRRIRKTVRTIQTLQAATLEDAVGAEHTAETYRRHYLPSTTTKVLAAQLMRTAQDELLESVRNSGPTIVGIAAEKVVTAQEIPPDAVDAASKELAASAIDKSLLPVTCRDEFNSPFGDTGGLCSTMITHCLICPNAYIFEDHVPRLAAYEQILENYRSELSPVEFERRYGTVVENLNSAMSAMDPGIVGAARKAASDTVLNLPVGMRVSLS